MTNWFQIHSRLLCNSCKHWFQTTNLRGDEVEGNRRKSTLLLVPFSVALLYYGIWFVHRWVHLAVTRRSTGSSDWTMVRETVMLCLSTSRTTATTRMSVSDEKERERETNNRCHLG